MISNYKGIEYEILQQGGCKMLTNFQFTLLQLLKEQGPLSVDEIVEQMGDTDPESVQNAIDVIGPELIAQNGDNYHAINPAN